MYEGCLQTQRKSGRKIGDQTWIEGVKHLDNLKD